MGWVIAIILLILAAAGIYVWTNSGGNSGGGGGGGQQPPSGGDLGDCTVGGHVSHGKTLDECRDMGGTVFQPDDKTKLKVNPQSGNPLD